MPLYLYSIKLDRQKIAVIATSPTRAIALAVAHDQGRREVNHDAQDGAYIRTPDEVLERLITDVERGAEVDAMERGEAATKLLYQLTLEFAEPEA